jgi:hypothetical protein
MLFDVIYLYGFMLKHIRYKIKYLGLSSGILQKYLEIKAEYLIFVIDPANPIVRIPV